MQGERKAVHRDDTDFQRRIERNTGKVCRTIAVPFGCDSSKAQANFSNGVLKVMVINNIINVFLIVNLFAVQLLSLNKILI